ncbi:MAG TPA: penicillin-binding protein 2 [Candidatus Eremiobacteraceae bacterium]|nr:penicillin-binding protein 2 [Candidatus Eremiobacteraceae bacterium]
MKEKERRRLRTRASVLFWLILLVAGLLGARLYKVQINESAALAADAGDQQRSTFPISGRRGDVVDRFGVAFATSLPASAIYAQPAQVKNADHAARLLAPLLGYSVTDIESVLHENASYIYIARNVPQSVADRVDRLGLAGIGRSDEALGLRVEPQGRVGSTLVGFTGVDSQGLAGVEVAFNDVLEGKAGQVMEATDNNGRPIPFGARVVQPAVVGDTVVLTIDRMLEYEAEEILRATAERYHAADGSAIIMRAQTGEILALANYPNFDPNRFANSPPSTWRDRAITDPFEPGSTFKAITAAAALDSGKMTVDDTFPARDEIEVGNRIIHNADDGMMASGHRYETIDDIVTFSHNVGAAQIAMRVGPQTMYSYIKKFGLDDPTGVDLPGESGGILGSPEDWYGSRLATIGFGQGVSVTALQMATAYAAIANGGVLMKPLIVHAIVGPDGRIVKSFSPQVVRRVIKPETSAALMTILRDVVRRGTATAAKMPGYELAGKTGTAQMVIDGSYVPGAYTASFAGIIPADKPEYVIFVKLDRPQGEYYGSIVALPAFRDLAGRVFWRESVVPRGDLGTITDPERAGGQAVGEPGLLGNNGRQQ